MTWMWERLTGGAQWKLITSDMPVFYTHFLTAGLTNIPAAGGQQHYGIASKDN